VVGEAVNSLPGLEAWYFNEYPYTTGGWLITRGGPWKPGDPTRIVASVQNWASGEHIVADHNAHAAPAVKQ